MGALKAQGVKPGVSDVVILHRGGMIAIELKSPAGRLSEPQAAFLDAVRRHGHRAHVARSVREVEEIVRRAGLTGRLEHSTILLSDGDGAPPTTKGATAP